MTARGKGEGDGEGEGEEVGEGDGSENVTFKKNSRFFKLCRAYSNSMKMSNVGEFS